MKKLFIGFFSILFFVACGNKKEETAPIDVKPANIAVGVGKITPQGGVSNLASPVAGIVSEIAVTTGGKYFRATDNASLKSIYSEIDQMEKVKISVHQYSKKQEEYKDLALLIFALLLMEILLRYTLFRNIP